VVLRQLNKDLQMICYTDSRTEKVAQINKNPDVCLVLYHQEERCQVKIKGKARVACDNEESEKHWKNVQPKAQGAYQSLLAPKTPIQKPKQGWEQDSEKQSRFFSVLFIIPEQVECLQLSGGNHLRIAFEKGKEDWIPTWLVP
jgi:pyridoxine/pyridoxamine 5'-phosphate oxidase